MICGKNATANSAAASPTIKGSIGFTIFSMGIPVMEDETNRFVASGGVQKAMDKARIMMIPN